MYIQNNLLKFDDEPKLKHKKIGSHTFVQLIGKNKFNLPGDCVLNLVGLYSSKIDPFYTKRGKIAEEIVRNIYSQKFQITFNEPNVFDNFTENKDFGGCYDIFIQEKNVVIEIKSKSMKDYQFFNYNNHDDEIYQGLYLACMKKCQIFVMEWIFFDEQSENEIKEGKNLSTYNNIKRISKLYKVEDFGDVENLFQDALNFYELAYNNKAIPLDYISDNMLKSLGLDRPKIDYTIQNMEVTL